MIEIEKNVPMPEGRGLSGRFPFGDMKVGDSFAVDVPPDTLAVHVGSFAARIRNTANHCAKKGGMKFSTLLVEGKKRVRVWRTK
ncbi:MAG: hypothetical protein IPL15_23880 [Comamonadaceae bacterium]|jgi:hypothetical protein|uniref:hypothetical protein n=1 Tax=Candidatus Skiveiella danica TaxID=3386177 RepID=UPI00390AA687|nr:hypothetical protein [Comamonadaceae bacterium]